LNSSSAPVRTRRRCRSRTRSAKWCFLIFGIRELDMGVFFFLFDSRCYGSTTVWDPEKLTVSCRLDEDVEFPKDCINVLRTRPFRFAARKCNKWAVGRAILCGDAAHVFPPCKRTIQVIIHPSLSLVKLTNLFLRLQLEVKELHPDSAMP
jgi:hypothetical protein